MQNIIVIRHGKPQTLTPGEAARFAFAAGDEVFIRTSDGTTPAQLRVRGNDLVLLTPNGEVLMPNLAALLADVSLALYFNSVLIEMTAENGAVQLEAHRTVDAAEAIHSAPVAFAQADENAQVDDKVATVIGQIESEPPASGGAVQFSDISGGFPSSLGNSLLGQTGLGHNSSQGASGQISTATIPSTGSSGNFNDAPVFTISSGQGVSVATTTTAATAIDTIAPPPPSLNVNDDIGAIIGSVHTAGYTDDAHPTFNGNAEAGSTVNLYDQLNPIGSAIAGADGHWQFTPGSALSDGSHSIRATNTDAAGNTSLISDAFMFSVDTVAPEAGFVFDDYLLEGVKFSHMFRGLSKETSLTFSVYDNGKFLISTHSGDIDPSYPTYWQMQPPDGVVKDGLHRFTLNITDTAGNTIYSVQDSLVDVTNGVWSKSSYQADVAASAWQFDDAIGSGDGAVIVGTVGFADSIVLAGNDFGGTAYTIDFTKITGEPCFQSYERFDITGTDPVSNNTLVLRAEDVLSLSDTDLFNAGTEWNGLGANVNRHQLIVDGDNGDSLQVLRTGADDQWQSAGAVTHNGQSYNVYNSTAVDAHGVGAQLLVNAHVAVLVEDAPHASLPV